MKNPAKNKVTIAGLVKHFNTPKWRDMQLSTFIHSAKAVLSDYAVTTEQLKKVHAKLRGNAKNPAQKTYIVTHYVTTTGKFSSWDFKLKGMAEKQYQKLINLFPDKYTSLVVVNENGTRELVKEHVPTSGKNPDTMKKNPVTTFHFLAAELNATAKRKGYEFRVMETSQGIAFTTESGSLIYAVDKVPAMTQLEFNKFAKKEFNQVARNLKKGKERRAQNPKEHHSAHGSVINFAPNEIYVVSVSENGRGVIVHLKDNGFIYADISQVSVKGETAKAGKDVYNLLLAKYVR